MTDKRVTRVLCAADPQGSADDAQRLVQLASERDVHAIAIVGALGTGRPDTMRDLFKALGRGGVPVYWVPGPRDAPIAGYLREAYNAEVVFPSLHGVHGTAAFSPDRHLVIAGLGGEISDDPDGAREEVDGLRYPRWEAEYRLKIVSELEPHQPVLLFSTPPAHKGAGLEGSEVVAELVATHRARLVVCGGPPGVHTLGRTMVVSPGSLAEGNYAIADLHAKQAELEQLAAART
jgi:Icc-related predicted phosphoesterase